MEKCHILWKIYFTDRKDRIILINFLYGIEKVVRNRFLYEWFAVCTCIEEFSLFFFLFDEDTIDLNKQKEKKSSSMEVYFFFILLNCKYSEIQFTLSRLCAFIFIPSKFKFRLSVVVWSVLLSVYDSAKNTHLTICNFNLVFP